MTSVQLFAWIGLPVLVFLLGAAFGAVKLTVALTTYFTKTRNAAESTAESNQGIREDLLSLGKQMNVRFGDLESRVVNHGERIVVLEDFKRRVETK